GRRSDGDGVERMPNHPLSDSDRFVNSPRRRRVSLERPAQQTRLFPTAPTRATWGRPGGQDMRDLSLVGLSEDRRYVLVRSASGERFRLPVDESLRAALSGDRARLGQLEIQMDSALRPRDIQARIRRGESPEEVADAAK